METVIVEKDINVYCITAKSFPEGILDAHQKLHALFPPNGKRFFFGISRPENGVIIYKAAAEVLEVDKERKLDGEPFVINKGRYRCITVLNYWKDPQGISKAFDELISDPDIDPNGYCMEFYYNEKDVKCMVPLIDIEIDL